MGKPRLAVIIPDCHVPYHHKKAFKLMQKILLDLKKEIVEICFLGDFLDMYFVSTHPKDPRVCQSLLDEVEEANELLDWFDRHFPRALKVFLEGNHEFRLERYLSQTAPALFGVTDLRFLLKMNLRPNWRYCAYGPNQAHRVLGSNLIARHTPPGSSAKQAALKAGCSVVYGHIHRSESAHAVGLLGQTHHAYSPGWLGDQRHKEIFEYVQNHHQWQLGFSLVYQPRKGSKNLFPQIIHISDDIQTQVNGKFYDL